MMLKDILAFLAIGAVSVTASPATPPGYSMTTTSTTTTTTKTTTSCSTSTVTSTVKPSTVTSTIKPSCTSSICPVHTITLIPTCPTVSCTPKTVTSVVTSTTTVSDRTTTVTATTTKLSTTNIVLTTTATTDIVLTTTATSISSATKTLTTSVTTTATPGPFIEVNAFESKLCKVAADASDGNEPKFSQYTLTLNETAGVSDCIKTPQVPPSFSWSIIATNTVPGTCNLVFWTGDECYNDNGGSTQISLLGGQNECHDVSNARSVQVKCN